MKYARKKSCMALIFFLALILFSNFTGEINTSAASHENNAQTFKITSTSGENITLAVTGNVSEGQITDFSFMNLPDQYNNTDIDFNMIELNGSNAFVNMTIPKNAILGGTEPGVAINGGLSRNNGFTQDNENFYVWFTTQPLWDNNNRSQVSVRFLLAPNHKDISFCRQTFIVPASASQTVNVTLVQGETMSGSVYLSDSYGKYFNFAVIDPNGHSIVQYEHADSKLWKFIAEMNGIYSLAVVNPSASATNSVTLEYSVVNNVPTNYSFASLLSLVVFGVVIAVGIGLAVVFLIIQSKPKASHKVLYS
jgi:hypothetical protein